MSTAAPVMYNIENSAQDLELEFVAYDAGSSADLSVSECARRECASFAELDAT